jgi:hypothetical protein
MGIQTGSITFKGKLGNVVGRMVNGTPVIQTPGGFTSEKLKRGRTKKYVRVFENATEFGLSTNLAKAIHLIPDASLHRSHRGVHAFQKLVGKIHSLRTLDTDNPRGRRRPTADTLKYLVGHEFNPSSTPTLKVNYSILTINSESIEVNIFNPINNLRWPAAADGVELISFSAQPDETLQKVTNLSRQSQPFQLDTTENDLTMIAPLFPERTLIILALRFYQVLNERIYPLADSSYSPMQIAWWQE